MKNRKLVKILAGLLLLALTLSLAACAAQPANTDTPPTDVPANDSGGNTPSQGGADDPGGDPGDSGTPAAGDDSMLRVAWITAYSTIDPHYAAADSDFMLCDLIYESFYDIDQFGNEDPRLAERYEVSADGMTYTYYLKSGVKWQTGEDFTAADVLYSIDRAMESPYMIGYLASIADVQAPDDHTVVFTLAWMNPAFHIELSRVRFLSESATSGLEPGFSSGIPGGTGPYTLVSLVMDQKAVFTRSSVFHGAPAPIGNIEVTVLSDTNSAVRAMEAGEIDYLIADGDNWERLSATGRFNAYTADTITIRFFAMNNERAPFDDPLVRQAINYAVDKEDMIYGSVGGYGVPAAYLANPNLNNAAPAYSEIFEYEYNPQRAIELLAEAGYPDGLVIDDPILTAATDEFAIPAQILQQQLRAVGIQIEISTVELSSLVMDMVLGNYGIGILALGLEPDAALMSPAYTSEGFDALNLARYYNDRVEELFAIGGSTLDINARKAAYREAMDIASREAAYLPLYALQATVLTTPGLYSTPYQNMYYWYWE